MFINEGFHGSADGLASDCLDHSGDRATGQCPSADQGRPGQPGMFLPEFLQLLIGGGERLDDADQRLNRLICFCRSG
jgi:hypothetical protein